MENNNVQNQDIKIYDDGYVLSEIDFYPPPDTRNFRSGINDIHNGDNYDDFVDAFYNLYYNDLFDD